MYAYFHATMTAEDIEHDNFILAKSAEYLVIYYDYFSVPMNIQKQHACVSINGGMVWRCALKGLAGPRVLNS